MKSNLWLGVGVLLLHGEALDAKPHRHHAIQLVWPDDECLLEVGNRRITGPVVIAAGVEHRLLMRSGWIVLIEPRCTPGESLAGYLQGNPFREIENLPAPPATAAAASMELPVGLLTRLAGHLNLDWNRSSLVHNTVPALMDKRIAALQARLNTCFSGDCVKPEHWKASEVASGLALSEGRFLHLFRQEMGITWRHYLLWRRLLCAVNVLLKGGSATVAAQAAGFSDSAHLSRTFHTMFGLTIRKAQALFG